MLQASGRGVGGDRGGDYVMEKAPYKFHISQFKVIRGILFIKTSD